MPRRARTRTAGLRRDDIAELAGMSTDYYARLERGTGPQPSEQMIAAIARALRLTVDERDHIFVLAGIPTPSRYLRAEHVSRGLMRILDRMDDTPAMVLGALGETLVQNRLATALFGDETRFTGPSRSAIYRWFTDAAAQSIYAPESRDFHARTLVSQLQTVVALHGPGSPADTLAKTLQSVPAFAELWERHEIGLKYSNAKRLQHPEVGHLELDCQMMLEADQTQVLLVFTAEPGSESDGKLAMLGVVGAPAGR
jgi:transcriptional regulator with XRE-family HTH domain